MNFVRVLLLMLSLLAIRAGAETDAFAPPAPITDSKLGDIMFQIDDVIGQDQNYNPFNLTILVKCKDNRKTPNAAKPETHIVLSKQICSFIGYKWDAKKHTLTFDLYEHIDEKGEATCNSSSPVTIALKENCVDWNR